MTLRRIRQPVRFNVSGGGGGEVEVHVATTGNDSTGDGSSGNPWRTPEFGAKQLVIGETLLIHVGTYILNESNLPVGHTTMDRFRALVSPPNSVDGTIGSQFTIKSAGDGTVLLDGGISPEWMTVGTNYGNYVNVIGISSRGSGCMMASDNSSFIDCDLYGGIDTPVSNGGDNFGCVLRVEITNNCLVQNCKLHDNQLGINQVNSPLIIEYDTTDLIVEYCDMYNSVGPGMWYKDNPHEVTIRYNHIYDNALSGFKSTNQDTGQNIYIHNNLFRNNNTDNSGDEGGITTLIIATDWQIYNNTFINNGYADVRSLFDSANGVEVWNNIFLNSASFFRLGYGASGTTFGVAWDYSDYNNFDGIANWQEQSTSWTTLASFVSANTLDGNSVDTSPNFIDDTGSTPADFKRSSYPTNGRGGIYEDVMGCYIDGTEQIGSTL